jgi:hypothetical protein
MMRLLFYWGPGNLVTKIIRLLTDGPYSHVELQFTDGERFFSSGHGPLQGSHMEMDHKIYGRWWDVIWLVSTPKQEAAAERYAFLLVGFPFDWRGMLSFLVPRWRREKKGGYCSSMIMQILQKSLHLYPNACLKSDPNGLYRLFIEHPDRRVSLDITSQK